MWLYQILFIIALRYVGGTVAVPSPTMNVELPWPLPNEQTQFKTVYSYDPNDFSITVIPQKISKCNLVQSAIQRFKDNMKILQEIVAKRRNEDKKYEVKNIERIATTENYLTIDKDSAHLLNKTRVKRELELSPLKPTLRPEDELDEIPLQKTRETRKTTKKISTQATTKSPPEIRVTAPLLVGLVIKLVQESPQDYPYLGMQESYYVTFEEEERRLYLLCIEKWGIIRGLETISQLFYLTPDYMGIMIDGTTIKDEPVYSHRGLLLETGHHFISVEQILRTLDAMAMNKMNVFHWVIVYDHSFPFKSEKYPELSQAGAFHPKLVYSKSDIYMIVDYARTLGIRVIPELDIPVHIKSIQASHPNIIVVCNGDIGEPDTSLNPILDETYEVVSDLIHEMLDLFPDEYFCLGGTDIKELQYCWTHDPKISHYMTDRNITFMTLLSQFYEKVVSTIPSGKKLILWEGASNLDSMSKIPNLAVEVNEDNDLVPVALFNQRQVIWSKHFELVNREQTFNNLYVQDPRFLAARHVQCSNALNRLVIGADLTVTTPKVDDSNIHSHIWPRASAMAEALWTKVQALNWTGVRDWIQKRCHVQACRMLRRGIPVRPLGPSFCVTADNVVKSNLDDFDNGSLL